MESRIKAGKTVTFSGVIVPNFCHERIDVPFLHVLDPNSPSFYVFKMSKKMSKNL